MLTIGCVVGAYACRLLTLEDIWYEEQVVLVAANMLQQVHMLGEG